MCHADVWVQCDIVCVYVCVCVCVCAERAHTRGIQERMSACLRGRETSRKTVRVCVCACVCLCEQVSQLYTCVPVSRVENVHASSVLLSCLFVQIFFSFCVSRICVCACVCACVCVCECICVCT